ncbi:MAG TPA: tandem-95 repeat protein [Pyrinomonadaceae bacterium]|nr:tandem-95 repeat protein [Pyrinomonadaceae bacterium]
MRNQISPKTSLLMTLIFAACLLAVSAQTVSAATFTVDTLDDDPSLTACTDDLSDCSLRGAIAAANSNAGSDVIDFAVIGEIVLSTNGVLPTLSSDIAINGPGATKLTIRRDTSASNFRIFGVSSLVTISGLTIANGNSFDGGGISVFSGELTVIDCIISDNRAQFKGAGISNSGTLTLRNSTVSGNRIDVPVVDAYGSGIYNNRTKTLTLENTTVSSNVCQYLREKHCFGGGIANDGGTLTINNSTLAANYSSHGAIWNDGVLNINSSILANLGIGQDIVGAVTSGDFNLLRTVGGITGTLPGTHNITGVNPMLGPLQFNGGSTMTHMPRWGSPAIDAGNNANAFATDQRGSARTTNDLNVADAADSDGTDIGAVESDYLVVNTTAQDDDGACQPLATGDCTLREAIIEANAAPGIQQIVFDIPTTDPGYDSVGDRYTITLTSVLPPLNGDMSIEGLGAKRLTVNRDPLSDNFGVFTVNEGKTATISGLSITGGYAFWTGVPYSGGGGAISNKGTLTVNDSFLSGNRATFLGGGIVNSGSLTLNRSTLSANTSESFGGGIVNEDGGTMVMNNSTVSGNNAEGIGGGIDNGGVLTVNNSTVAGNAAGFHGGGIRNSSHVTLNSTILANNTAPNGPDMLYAMGFERSFSGDYNLIENISGVALPLPGTHNVTGVDPKLSPLQDNAGSTLTHTPLCGSRAIDQGKNVNSFQDDQRGFGFGRTFNDPGIANAVDGDSTDIGALEIGFALVCNTAPVANNDGYSTDEDTALSGGSVLGNDTDGESDPLVATLVVGPTHAQSFSLNGDGTFSYTPNSNYHGTDSFTYKANDGSLDSNEATAIITVNAVADTPSVTNATTNEDVQSTSGLVVSRNAADGAEVTHFKITNIDNGSLYLNDGTTIISGGDFLTFAQANAGLKFTPSANFFGPATFNVQASQSASETGLSGGVVTATITVIAVNDPPDAVNDSFTLAEDGVAQHYVLTNDSILPDVGETLSITGVTQGAHGLVEILGGGTHVRYTPVANYNGTDSFTYTISDGNGGVDSATVNVNVFAVNDAPQVSATPKTQPDVQYSDPIQTVNINASDLETSAASLTIAFAHARNGGAIMAGLPFGMTQGGTGGAWTVSGTAGAPGTYVITATVSDTGDGSAPARSSSDTFTIVVVPEAAIAAPRMSNPNSMQVSAPGGTASGTTGDICFDISEVVDGTPGDPTVLVGRPTFQINAVGGGGGAGTITYNFITFPNSGQWACVRLILTNTPVNVYEVTFGLGSSYYTGSGTTVFTVFDPSAGFASGGGWVINPSTGYRGNYGVNVKYLKNGNYQGSVLYVEHRPDGDYKVKSTSLNSTGGFAIVPITGGSEAQIAGKANHVVNDVGTGNHSFIARVIDKGTAGTNDQFGFKLINPSGQTVFSFDPVLLGGGNNQVPKK